MVTALIAKRRVDQLTRNAVFVSLGHQTVQFSLTGSTSGAGDWVSFTYNSDGTVAARSDPGGTTTSGYDQWGQVNRITYPNGLGSEGLCRFRQLHTDVVSP